MINHHNASGLATSRENPEVRRSAIAGRLRTLETSAFSDAIRAIARRLYFSTPTATTKEHEFLQEVAREECRVQMKQLQRLLGIAAQSTRPEDREALVDLVRHHCDVQRECLDVIVASDLETAAQGAGDVDIRQFERQRTRATKERALASLRRHFAALRALIDSIEAQPVQ